MYAHYTSVNKNRKIITITPTPKLEIIGTKVIMVSGKRQARAKAKELNAKPWNF